MLTKQVTLASYITSALNSAWEENSSLIQSTENRLKFIHNNIKSNKFEQIKSDAYLFNFSKEIFWLNKKSKIDTIEEISFEHAIFVDSFLKKINQSTFSQEEIISEFEKFLPLFRKRRIFSIMSNRRANLEYINHKDLPKTLANLCYRCDSQKRNSYLWFGLILSSAFVAIHPFSDENGRSSRRILSYQLTQSDIWGNNYLPLGFFFNRDRERFIEIQNNLFLYGDWSNYVNYICSALLAAAEFSLILNFNKFNSSKNNHDC